jgi:hypothetical protein
MLERGGETGRAVDCSGVVMGKGRLLDAVTSLGVVLMVFWRNFDRAVIRERGTVTTVFTSLWFFVSLRTKIRRFFVVDFATSLWGLRRSVRFEVRC